MKLPVLVKAEGADQLKKLNRQLKDAAAGDLRRQLRRGIKDAGKPVVTDLKAAVKRVDVTSSRGGTAYPDRSTGLRRTTAKATGLSVTQSGIRIRVSSKRMASAGYPPTIAKYLDASVGKYDRWRHPVFGQMSVWVEQKGQPWFFKTINRHRAAFRRAVFGVIQDVRDEIARL